MEEQVTTVSLSFDSSWCSEASQIKGDIPILGHSLKCVVHKSVCGCAGISNLKYGHTCIAVYNIDVVL